MKKILIITPHYPPINAADMHRIRQSIAYYSNYGWDAELVVVEPDKVDINKDDLLIQTVPSNIVIHKVSAFSKKITSKFGLGSIAYRSILYYYKYVNNLLRSSKYDLIFFSTTAFPLTILGRIWKKKYHIPYVIDFQDPWRSDHYLELPQSKRPPKFWFSYVLDSILEKFAIAEVNGLISVSDEYIKVLEHRYPRVKSIPTAIIPFAAFRNDIDVARNNSIINEFFSPNTLYYNIVYVGRGGYDMLHSCNLFLKSIKKLIDKGGQFEKIRCYFIGTSYDSSENAPKLIESIAKSLNIEKYIFEQTQRVGYFNSLKLLSDADFLFVPGSDNIGYTASKIYQYVWLNKPLLTLFHSSSSVNTFINDCNAGYYICFDKHSENQIVSMIENYILKSMTKPSCHIVNWTNFSSYTAEEKTKIQVDIFNQIIDKWNYSKY